MSTILVVDDSPVDRRLIGGLLRKSTDWTIEYASNGEEALIKIRDLAPSLVVTDLIMPKVDGLALVAEVVREYPLVPIILLTGKGNEEIAVQALQRGAASYVPKSRMASLLTETVENVLTAAWEERQQVRLMDCMLESDCTFELTNDATMIPPLINYVHQGIRSVGLCDEANGIRVSVALEEALNNAMFHGNLELSSELREGNRSEYRQMLEQRRNAAPYRERKIRVHVKLTRAQGMFVIKDEGPGFDPHGLPDPTDPANLEKASGRGILLMRTFMDGVEFNEQGNEVRMVKYATAPSDNGSTSEAKG